MKLALLLLLLPLPAWAHGGDEFLPSWTFDPYVVTPLLVAGALYTVGLARLWRRAGWGRGIRLWQAGSYALGWLALAGALVTPLHWLGERLFTAHMVEHEVVMAVAAPLIALARPIGAVVWALPVRMRTKTGRIARGTMLGPLAATVVHGAVIWIWHTPVLFDAAVVSTPVHRLQHVCFLVSALAFWWALVRRCERGAAVLHLFATATHTGLLGALLVVAPRVLYLQQTANAADWGLTPLEDQQLAGLVMWIPAGTVYAGAALAFAALWIRHSGQGWRPGHALRPS